MNARVLPVPAVPTMAPIVTEERTLGDLPVANQPLHDAQCRRLAEGGWRISRDEPGLVMRGDAWLSAETLAALANSAAGTRLVDAAGTALAWRSATETPPTSSADVVEASDNDLLLRYPWQLLDVNRQLLDAIGQDDIRGDLDARAVVEGRLVLGEGSRVLPGVYIEGTVIIGRDCKIGPNCYLRGRTAIGDGCHIGQAVEIKNSVIMNRSSIGHLSYCGDSVIGERVNFGAGTITANLRHDGRNHRSAVDGELVETGRRKLGVIVGDDVHTGIHTSLYPGRKLWPGTATRPGDVVQRDITA